jgi:4,5:9,10-diseco-3-hydroxy-5,9,17-trioxoandrosta-1(10),2-diene-4-oate hydrolase
MLSLESVVLLGNSIGGATAARYAAEHPGRVKALILCNPGGLDAGGRTARAFTSAFAAFFGAGRRHARWFPWVFAQYYKRVLIGKSARPRRDAIIQSAYDIAPILEQAWRSFASPEADLRNYLPRLCQPVLLAWARSDFTNQLKRCRPAFAQFPNYELQLFEGGHAAFLEDPDRFERVLRQFLLRIAS